MHGRIYSLYLTPYSKLIIVFGAVFPLLLAILFLSAVLGTNSPATPPRWLGLVVLPIAAVTWYPILFFPRRIVVTDDAEIEVVSLLRRWHFNARDVLAIMPHPYALGILVLKHRSGKLWLLNQFDGFHEFLTLVKSQNPSIQLRGV